MPALDVFIYVKWKCLLSSVRICCSVKTLILLSHCIVLSSREHVKSSPLSFPLIMVRTEATLPGESWRELDVFASPVLTFGGCNSAEEVVVCDTKPPGIERCIMHRGQSRPMYVSPSELKILNYLLIPEKKLLLTWSYLQNFFGECWTLPYVTSTGLFPLFHWSVNNILFPEERNPQTTRACNGWVQDTQKRISAMSTKEAEAMNRGDRPFQSYQIKKDKVWGGRTLPYKK